MNLTKFTENMDKIASLDDQPALTSSELKAKFDEGGKAIKTYLNDLTDEITDQVGDDIADSLTTAKGYTDEQIAGIDLVAENITYDNDSSGLTADNVQDALDEVKTSLDSVISTADEKIKYNDFDFSTSTLTGTLTPRSKQNRNYKLK